MVLLLQFRSDAAGWHEIKCFYEVSGLDFSDLQIVNLFTPDLDWGVVDLIAKSADKIIVGGSGETGYEHQNDAHFFNILDNLRPLLMTWVDAEKYIFGVCLGHQILGDVLGGEVVPSAAHAETGTVMLNKTKLANHDPLFKDLPSSFFVSTAHKTSVLSVPGNVQLLASSPSSPIQALRYKNAWGVQYHPELDDEKLDFRLQLYKSYVRNQVDDIEPKDYTSAKAVLQNFLAL